MQYAKSNKMRVAFDKYAFQNKMETAYKKYTNYFKIVLPITGTGKEKLKYVKIYKNSCIKL